MSLTSFVPYMPFDEYKERFKEHFVMERNDGVLEVHMHTLGGVAKWSYELHRAWGQLFKTVAADRENELMIITGTGDYWLYEMDGESFAPIEHDEALFNRNSHDYWYRDGLKLQENLIWDIDFPTIAAINGPGFHTEFGLLCDLTLCAEDALFVEGHFIHNHVPGDALFLVLQQLLGLKRANFAMYTGGTIPARVAMKWGLVNEVLPRDQLMPRARELAKGIMSIPRLTRQLTTQLVKRPWRRALTDDFQMHFAHELWSAHVVKTSHSPAAYHGVLDKGKGWEHDLCP